MKQQDDNTVVLQVFETFLEANHVKNVLLESGVESFLVDENVIGLNPLGGIELKVLQKDYNKAASIFENLSA